MLGLDIMNCEEFSGDDLIKSGRVKSIQDLINDLKWGRLEARDPDQGYPIIPVNRLQKKGTKYNILNSFIAIFKKCDSNPRINMLHCLESDSDSNNLFMQNAIRSLKTITIHQIKETRYYQVLQLTIPKFLFDYTCLVQGKIKCGTKFWFSCQDVAHMREQHLDKKICCSSGAPFKPPLHTLTLKLIKMTPDLVKWEFISAPDCNRWKFIQSFEHDFLNDICVKTHKTCMEFNYENKNASNIKYSFLPIILVS